MTTNLLRRIAPLFMGLCYLMLPATNHAADLAIGVAADVTSLDPHFLNSAPNIEVAGHFFDTLIQVDADGKLVPGLALSWRAVDNLTWELKLRRNVKFHDGSPFTAEDAIFSLERPASLTKSPGPFTPFTKQIVLRQSPDAYTLRLKTAEPHATLPLDLASVFIVSKKAAREATSEEFNNGHALIGTGPFRFSRFRRGEAIEMARNEAYWGPLPPWAHVTLRLLPNDSARITALLAGQVDMIAAVPSADIPRLKTDARFRLAQRISWRTLFLQLDQRRDRSPFVTDASGKPLEHNPLKDARVRLALSKSIQRQALCERTMEGLAVPAAALVAPGLSGHNEALKPEGFDPEGAKRLLKEAGWPEGFALTIHGPNNRYLNDDQILQTVAQFFTRIGVKTRVETMPMAAYFGRLRNGDFSVGLLGWGSLAGDAALKNIAGTPDAASAWGAWNWTGYRNPVLDQTLHAALGEVHPEKRQQLAKNAAELAARDMAFIPLHHQTATWALRKGLAYGARVDEFTLAQQVRPE